MFEFIKRNKAISAISAGAFLLVYASTFNSAYGYFIDEFYYISCAARPAFGYVDHPPLAPLLLAIFSFIFGTSVYAIRILPAAAFAITVFLSGRLAALLGGGNNAITIASLAFACSPVAVTFAGFYSMNIFEPLLAILMIMETVKLVRQAQPKRWLNIGLIMGLGIMNKHTYVIAAVILILSIAVVEQRRVLLSRYFIYGMAAACLIALPNLIWQVLNHFPSVEFYRNITVSKNVYTPPAAFITQQIMFMSPSNALIWFAGMIFLLMNKTYKDIRFTPLFFILSFLFMMLSGTSRPDRLLMAYPVVFAGGAVFFERLFARVNFKPLFAVLPILLTAGLLISIPVTLPYFSYQWTADYTKAIGLNTELERGKKPPLPQILADRIGWQEKADLIFSVYNNLNETEKRSTIIAADNYGKAGALELFGAKYGIKEVFCGHNSFYLWGKGHLHGTTVVILDDAESLDDYQNVFDSVVVSKNEFVNPFVSSHENHLVVYTCRNARYPLETIFERGKFYY